MTDRPDDLDPSSTSGEARRLRRHLDTAVAAPVPDAWDRIRARVEDGSTVVRLDRPNERRLSGRVLLGAAAAILVVAGVVAAIATRGDGPGPGRVHTAPDGPTGFYVPGDLPEGWRVRDIGITAIDQPARCPCTIRRFRYHDGGSVTAVASDVSSPELWLPDADERSLADIGGRYDDGGLAPGARGPRTAVWPARFSYGEIDGIHVLTSSDLDEQTLFTIARDWARQPGDRPPLNADLESTHRIDHPIATQVTAVWTFERPGTPQRIRVWLSPEGPTASQGRDEVRVLGNGMPARVDQQGQRVRLSARRPGGAEIAADNFDTADAGPGADPVPAPPDVVEAVLGTFRPVGAATWAAHLTDGPPLVGDPRPATTATIGDWNVAGRPMITAGSDDGDESGLLTVRPPGPRTGPSGNVVGIPIKVTNETGRDLTVRACLNTSATISLRDSSGSLRGGSTITDDCGGGPRTATPGEDLTVALSVDLRDVRPGRYTAIVTLSDLDVILRVPVTVT